MADFCAAISARAVLRVRYQGQVRVIEPHTHGWTSTGTEVLLVYQSEGPSASGESEGWKTLHVAKFESVEVMDVAFLRARSTFDPAAPEVGRIHCQVPV